MTSATDERISESVRGHRGRVVMMVDNGVIGDSRVQKSARSAADAGWDVILIGASATPEQQRWQIGDAEVRLLPLSTAMHRPLAMHRWSLRRPLAYRPDAARFYVGAAQVRRANVSARYAAIRAGRASLGQFAYRAKMAALLGPRLVSKVTYTWARLRNRQLKDLRNVRQDPNNLLNKFQIKWVQWQMGDRAWRRLDTSLWRYELAYGPVIDRLKPDVIHAHDWRMVGVGARATQRARAKGRKITFIWDAHEYVPGLPERGPRWLPAQCAYEREYARYADGIITVSEPLADMLKEQHQLADRPLVALNAPVSAPGVDEALDTPVPDLRALCGIDQSTRLLVYCGGISPVRGVDLMISAMPDLPGIHLALVSLHPSGRNAPADLARQQAIELGVADRVHFMPYVPHWQVSATVAAADAAVSPLVHLLNHEIALSNKFFEYSQARLPLIVSDTRTIAGMVRSTGQGEVFVAQDKDDYVRAVNKVLADPDRYRAAYDKPGLLDSWTWEAQAEKVDALYTRLSGLPGAVREPVPVR